MASGVLHGVPVAQSMSLQLCHNDMWYYCPWHIRGAVHATTNEYICGIVHGAIHECPWRTRVTLRGAPIRGLWCKVVEPPPPNELGRHGGAILITSTNPESDKSKIGCEAISCPCTHSRSATLPCGGFRITPFYCCRPVAARS